MSQDAPVKPPDEHVNKVRFVASATVVYDGNTGYLEAFVVSNSSSPQEGIGAMGLIQGLAHQRAALIQKSWDEAKAAVEKQAHEADVVPMKRPVPKGKGKRR